ncbi:MAG TPA: RNB domain-containing ribonuclease [Desulfobacteraceae bacterium]|nr:RNB domain-containing ribonuclease [Deltaproteobacteria bacterium]HDH88149.1 RNB domain-containing ribonuclease [Desulfobacteraceae bacterium]
MAEGKIIEYIDQRKIVLSVCVKDRGNKLQLLTISNHEVSISPKRALLISSATLNTSMSRGEILNKLKVIEKIRTDYMAQASVQDLWELTHEENRAFTYKYLAQLCFGRDITDDHISALVRALFADGAYFKIKDGSFIPNSPEKVEQIIKAREAAELRDRELAEGANFLREIINSRHPEEFPLKDKIIELLIQLALYGKDAPDYKLGKEMFSQAGIKDINKARHLLVKLNIWHEDENLDLHRLKIRTDFSEPVFKEADIAARKEIDTSARDDLTDLPIFTIDGPYTRDFDDALSLQPIEKGYRLGIHITDVTPFIEVDGCLDREAANRASSIYLPVTQIPMFPPSLSNNALSLVKGFKRFAISLFVNFDRDLNLKNFHFMPTIVRVEKQLTYDQVNAVYADDSILSPLYRLTQALRQKRAANGALLIPLPEIHFGFQNNSKLHVSLIEQDTPARVIVSECMILYNWLTAKFAAEKGLPILYRSQEPPQERLPIDESKYIYYVFQQRRKLRPLYIDTIPHPHSSLGVDIYTNATSPLRRYMDVLVQRQIHSALFQTSPEYEESRLKELNMVIQQALKDIDLMKRNQVRYWMLKYLAGCINDSFKAIVFQKLKYKYLIILTDFLFVAELPKATGLELSPGQEIKVVVKKSDPWDDILILELAD